MKFSREFYFCAHPFFSFWRKTNFRATAKKVWFCQTKTSRMLVVSEKKKKKNSKYVF